MEESSIDIVSMRKPKKGVKSNAFLFSTFDIPSNDWTLSPLEIESFSRTKADSRSKRQNRKPLILWLNQKLSLESELSEQVFPSKRSISKGLLVIGVVLLVSSFFFFYLASRIDYDYVTKYHRIVNFDTYPHFDPSVNNSFICVGVQWMNLLAMQPYDHLTIKVGQLPTNGKVSLTLESHTDYNITTFPYIYRSESGFIDFRNDLPTEAFVSVFLGSDSQNMTFSLPTTTTLHHYETPNWLLFGAGVVLASLGLVAVFKSKK